MSKQKIIKLNKPNIIKIQDSSWIKYIDRKKEKIILKITQNISIFK